MVCGCVFMVIVCGVVVYICMYKDPCVRFVCNLLCDGVWFVFVSCCVFVWVLLYTMFVSVV